MSSRTYISPQPLSRLGGAFCCMLLQRASAFGNLVLETGEADFVAGYHAQAPSRETVRLDAQGYINLLDGFSFAGERASPATTSVKRILRPVEIT